MAKLLVTSHITCLIYRASQYLSRDFNKAFVEVIGCYVHRGAGYGLEVHCFYRFYGPEPYIRILQELLSSLRADGLIQLNSYNNYSKTYIWCKMIAIRSMVKVKGSILCVNVMYGPRQLSVK